MKLSLLRCTAFAAALGLMSGCGDSTGVEGTTSLTVLLTDAPADYIDQAMVDIGTVELIGGEGGPVVLSTDGTDGPVNLLDLQGTATMVLADADIEAGTYNQLRLIVEAASVTLADGYEFNGGGNSMALTVPSGAQTGIKLNLRAASDEEDAAGGGVEFRPGEMALVVDFDVNDSFVIQGNPETPAGINGVSFKPTLRVVLHDVAGTVSGTVSTELEDVSVAGLLVTAEPVEGTTLEPFQSASASAMTDGTGAYSLPFLVPGDYVISVETAEGTATPVEVTVEESGDLTGVDLVIVAG